MKNKLYHIILTLILMMVLIQVKGQNINHPNVRCPGGVMINVFNGNMNLMRNDLFVEGRKFDLNMTFYYNSDDHNKNFGYGNGWGFKYLLKYLPDTNAITIRYADGFEARFSFDGNQYHAPEGVFDSFSEYEADKFVLTTKHKIKYFFDNSQHKRLTHIEEPNGNMLTLTYTDSLVTQITDASGRSIQLVYTAGKLTSITDTLDTPVRVVQYTYDAYGNLIEVTDPAGNRTKYKYLLNGPMNVVTDKNGNAVDIVYLSNFAVQEVISCITDQRFTYNANSRTTYVVEANNNDNQVTTYKFDENENLQQKKGNCCGYNVSYGYDGQKNVTFMIDANGNRTEYTYDTRGNMLSKRDALGHTSFYTYEPVFNKVISFTNRNGNSTTYTYDVKGNLTEVNYPLGISNQFAYAANGDLTSVTDGNGNTTTFEYNAAGDFTAIHQPLNVNHLFNYNGRSLLNQYTDPLNHSSSLAFDQLNRVASITDALNHDILFMYDANGNMLSYTDRNGHTSGLAYDALNRRIMFTDALNHSSHTEYDAKGNVIAMIDRNGNTTHYTYDHLNRLISMSNALNETTQYDYDNSGNLILMGLPNGNHILYTYDALHRMISKSDDIGNINTCEYDNVGNMLHQSDANGNTMSYEYDALNRMISNSDPLGHSVSYEYDDNSNLVSYEDRNGNTSSYAYDPLNRLILYTDALNFESGFDFDASGNLTSVTDANNHTTSYGYDALNRNILQTFADATTNIYGYDNNDNLISRTDNNGVLTTYTYDVINRMVMRDFPGSNDDVYGYDAEGRMVTASNQNAVVTMTYDEANRLTSESLDTNVTSYVYDIPQNLRTINYPGGRSIVRKLDERNRLIEIDEDESVLASFEYDDANRLIVKSYPANGTFTSYDYDADNRVISMITNPGGLLHFEYGYDNMGNKLFERKVHRPDRSEEYTYDDRYQLTDFKSGVLTGNTIPSPLHHNVYNYDPLRNRTTISEDNVMTTYTVDNMNAYTSISGAINSNPQYDDNGNLLDDGTYTYTYDTQNRLIGVNNGMLSGYKYDALGRRIQKTVGSDITSYLYSDMHEVENRDGTGNMIASYVFGSGIDNIVSMQTENQDYYYFKNALGSVSSIADNEGNIIERYDYDPFGKINIYDSGYSTVMQSEINNTISYTGRTSDDEIDKFYYRARHYDQNTGRFIQYDPLQYIDGMNLYEYVGNNVLNKTDPSGLNEWTAAAQLAYDLAIGRAEMYTVKTMAEIQQEEWVRAVEAVRAKAAAEVDAEVVANIRASVARGNAIRAARAATLAADFGRFGTLVGEGVATDLFAGSATGLGALGSYSLGTVAIATYVSWKVGYNIIGPAINSLVERKIQCLFNQDIGYGIQDWWDVDTPWFPPSWGMGTTRAGGWGGGGHRG